MVIKTPENLVITDKHARGHRRYRQQEVIKRLDQLRKKGLPKKFHPHVSEYWRQLRNAYGIQYSQKLAEQKKDAFLLIVEHNAESDLYFPLGIRLKRMAGSIQTRYLLQPFVFTGHFIERYIQLKISQEEDYVVTIAVRLIEELDGLHTDAASDKSELGSETVWEKSGPFALATKNLLILGNVPKQGDAVVKTLIHKTKLEERNRGLWLHLRRCKKHLKIGREL